VMLQLQFERPAYRCRALRDRTLVCLVGVFIDQTEPYALYLTDILADRLNAGQIAETYRLCSRLEFLFKELRTRFRLDQIPSAKSALL
jgi:IS4 transposase